MDTLAHYRILVAKVDALCQGISERFHEAISCRKGCDACCRHLSVSPVEGAALHHALSLCRDTERRAIVALAEESSPQGGCPLLSNGTCLLYDWRPIICRTQGMPLLLRGKSGDRIDFCPENFRDRNSFPGDSVIDLENLNMVLAGIDRLYVKESGDPPERVTIAEALLRKRSVNGPDTRDRQVCSSRRR